MQTKERVLLECRYLISLHKSYSELAKMFNISISTVKLDLNERLKGIDQKLFERVSNISKNYIH